MALVLPSGFKGLCGCKHVLVSGFTKINEAPNLEPHAFAPRTRLSGTSGFEAALQRPEAAAGVADWA